MNKGSDIGTVIAVVPDVRDLKNIGTGVFKRTGGETFDTRLREGKIRMAYTHSNRFGKPVFTHDQRAVVIMHHIRVSFVFGKIISERFTERG